MLLAAVALLPALAILAFNEITLRRDREAELRAYAMRLSESASLEMERIVTGAGALMIAVANMTDPNDGVERCTAELNRLQVTVPQVNLITMLDPEGNVWCSTDPSPAPPEDSAALRAMLEDRIFAIGTYAESSVGAGLMLATKSLGPDGAVTGYVLASVAVDYLGRIMRQRTVPEGSALTIADRNGVILAREPLPEQFVGNTIPESFRSLLTAPSPATMEVMSQDGTRRIIGYRPATLPLGLYISAGVGLDAAFAAINQATIRGVFLAATGGLIALLLAFILGRRFIQRPIRHILRTIASWRAGKRDARTGMARDGTEFHQLGWAIDGMLDEIGERQAGQERAEAHGRLLQRELDHRIKNLLATVQAIVTQTFRGKNVPTPVLDTLYARLAAMAQAHRLLTESEVRSATIRDAIAVAAAPFEAHEGERFTLEGPELWLTEKATLSLSMATHELCTNAVKYGALSSDEGKVEVRWASTEEGGFTLTWQESGGPEVLTPGGRGFGSRMIAQALSADLDAKVEFDYSPNGLLCTVKAGATALKAPPEEDQARDPDLQALEAALD